MRELKGAKEIDLMDSVFTVMVTVFFFGIFFWIVKESYANTFGKWKTEKVFDDGKEIVCFADETGYVVSKERGWKLTNGWFLKCGKNGLCVRLHVRDCKNFEH